MGFFQKQCEFYRQAGSGKATMHFPTGLKHADFAELCCSIRLLLKNQDIIETAPSQEGHNYAAVSLDGVQGLQQLIEMYPKAISQG